MALFAGDTFEDMAASLIWLFFLLVGRWNGIQPRSMMITTSDVMYGLHRDTVYHRLELPL